MFHIYQGNIFIRIELHTKDFFDYVHTCLKLISDSKIPQHNQTNQSYF